MRPRFWLAKSEKEKALILTALRRQTRASSQSRASKFPVKSLRLEVHLLAKRIARKKEKTCQIYWMPNYLSRSKTKPTPQVQSESLSKTCEGANLVICSHLESAGKHEFSHNLKIRPFLKLRDAPE